MKRAVVSLVAATAVATLLLQDRAGGQGLEPAITIEFDSIAAPGSIQAIRIGYFRPGARTPIRVIDLLPSEVVTIGKVMRVAAPRMGIESSGEVELRLQVVFTTLGPSDWSNPTGRVTLPVVPAPARRARRTPTPLSAADLDAHPALRAEFTRRLGSGDSAEQALSAFRTVQDVATAVALSRLYEVPFDRLYRLLAGPRALSMRRAVEQLKPSLDARQAIRAARVEGRRLLTPLPQPRP